MTELLSFSLPSLEGEFFVPKGETFGKTVEEWQLLGQLVYSEARGEPFWGQVAVAAVILNRLEHPDFPPSISGIIFQPGQFEVVANGTIYQTPNNLAYHAVREALAGVDPTEGSMFFWNPAKVGPKSWVWTKPIKLKIGNHVFA